MTYRYIIPKDTLAKQHIEFAKLYTMSRDSLEAYNQSHNHINKVRASSLLQSTAVWRHIYKTLKSNNCPDQFQKRVIAAYDNCALNIGLCPFDIFDVYTCQLPDGTKEPDIKPDDLNPLVVIRKLVFAFEFFAVIDRKHFLTKISKAINDELSYFKMLADKNDDWLAEKRTLIHEFKTLNFTNFEKIINYGTKTDN